MHKSIVLCDALSTEYLQEIENFLTEWESNKTTIVVHTSGSTGAPKEITLTKDAVRESAKATGKFFGFKSGQSLLLNLSPNYIAGKLMIVRALEYGMKIKVVANRQNPLLYLNELETDFAAFVPYQVEAILADEKSKQLYEAIPNVIIGGARISPSLERQLSSLSNQNYATFGMTETITHIALRNVTNSDSFYSCLPGITVGTDSRECLVIAKNKISEEIITNDLVTLIDESTFIWRGRVDNIINSGGIKIFPEELEQKIGPLLTDQQFYFFGRESEKFGQELVLYIEGEKPTNWNEIELEVNAKLDRYYRPKEVIFIPVFNKFRVVSLLILNRSITLHSFPTR